MNAKAAKTISLYVALRKSEGGVVAIKDVKRRFASLPWQDRGRVLQMMESYIAEREPVDAGGLRASRPRWGAEETARRGGLMGMIAAMLGLQK